MKIYNILFILFLLINFSKINSGICQSLIGEVRKRIHNKLLQYLKYNDTKSIKALLKKTKNFNINYNLTGPVEYRDLYDDKLIKYEFRSLLHIAVIQGDLELVKLLLKLGANINLQLNLKHYNVNTTPLDIALAHYYLANNFFLISGKPVNFSNYAQIIGILLQYGASVNKSAYALKIPAFINLLNKKVLDYNLSELMPKEIINIINDYIKEPNIF